PFAAGWKSGAAEATQPRVAHDLDQFVARALAGETIAQQRVTAGFLIGIEVGLWLPGVRMFVRLHVGGDFASVGMESLQMTDGADRGAVASAHARRANDANVLAELAGEFFQELLRARHRAGKRVADTHSRSRRRGFPLLHDIEMRVKS